ncbi:MAG: DUF4124 domain-containing protein [Halioglobus sp.]|nr:DUF4124 domain-containing protein [Halioglobus sp.]
MNQKMRAGSMATAVVLLTLSGWTTAAGGTYYRWTDATGTEVNSDRPPPAGIDYETVSKNTNLLQQETPQGQPTTIEAQSEPATKQNNDAAPPATATNAIIKKNPEYCEAAKKNLETLSMHGRIRLSDADGNIRYLNEDEKAEQVATAQAIIAQHCE